MHAFCIVQGIAEKENRNRPKLASSKLIDETDLKNKELPERGI